MENEGTARFAQAGERQGGFQLSGSFAKAPKLHINLQFQMTEYSCFWSFGEGRSDHTKHQLPNFTLS